jgi:predicted HD phosphohydrolase
MDIIDEIFALFAKYGDRGYGEDVNQREHALQAAHFAREAGEPDTLVVAALLHDIGQFLNEAGEAAEREGRDARHEVNGADLLARHFPEAVVAPVRMHVAAKRYLCAIDPAYHDGLSAATTTWASSPISQWRGWKSIVRCWKTSACNDRVTTNWFIPVMGVIN